MDRNFGEMALICAMAREKRHPDLTTARMLGLDENQVEWMARAGRNGVLRNVLAACDSVHAFCVFMDADARVKMQALKLAIESGSYLDQKSIEAARRRLSTRAPRAKARVNANARRVE